MTVCVGQKRSTPGLFRTRGCVGSKSLAQCPRGGTVDAAVFKTETLAGVWVRVPPRAHTTYSY